MPTPRFKPGQSGNPAGRPKNKTPSTMIRRAITSHIPEILKVVVDAAKSGDIVACKLLLDKACPNLKPKSEAIEFNIPADGDASTFAKDIISQMASGALHPDDALSALNAVSHQCKIVDIVELTARMDEFEAAQGKR